MQDLSCCFTGHRDIVASEEKEISESLNIVLKGLIEEGYTDFYSGGAIGFDALAAEAVLEQRKRFEHIRLHIIMPCENQTRGWSAENVRRAEKINSLADEVLCLSPHYFNGCMQVRNRYMADRSQCIVAYLKRTTGGSAYTVRYGEKKGLRIINIAKGS